MEIAASVKNIIFDFGGVILNIDYQLSVKAFENLGLKNFSEMYSQANQNQLFDLFEKGMILPSEFRNEIHRHIQGATDTEIDYAWNSMLLDLPVERITLLNKLKLDFNLFLLSNTNAIHHEVFTQQLKKSFKYDIFSGTFKKAYFSHEIHMRKPDFEIFEFVLNENNLKANETIFIDDSIQHVEAAAKLGIQAILLEKGKTILDLFS